MSWRKLFKDVAPSDPEADEVVPIAGIAPSAGGRGEEHLERCPRHRREGYGGYSRHMPCYLTLAD